MPLLRFPVPSSSRLLPSPLIRVLVPLLPSYFSFYLRFLRGLFIIGAPAPLGLFSVSALAFSLYMCFRIAGASLFCGYPGIHATVFSAIISSRLSLSRRFTSTLSAVRLQATYVAFRILLHLFGCSIAFACFHVTLR